MASALQNEIDRLEPATDHCQIVNLTLQDGFLWDMTRALELALFRTFAAPSIGGLLHRTGEFEQNGQKRYDDTTLLLLNILRHGYDSEVGAASIARMNKTHAHFKISNEDYLFVLSTFVIDPIDWTERFGWRKLSAPEKESLFLFWRNVGERMNLSSLPDSLSQMETESWQYVDEHFAYDEANQRVADGTVAIVQAWMPSVLGRFVRPVATALLDRRTSEAVGMQPPSALTKRVVEWMLRSRAILKRVLRLGHAPDWPTGHRTYPDGYQIDELAPAQVLKAEARNVDGDRGRQANRPNP